MDPALTFAFLFLAAVFGVGVSIALEEKRH